MDLCGGSSVFPELTCYPGDKQPDKIAIAICCRYLETEISKGNYKRIVCFCVDAIPIVKNIKERNSQDFEVVACAYPKNTITDEEKETITKALTF